MKRWIIGFFILQIVIDLTHSVTVFPFVHYGMFSASVARPDSVLVYQIAVDNTPLHPTDWRIYEWDMVQGPLEAAEKRETSGDFTFDKEKIRSTVGTPIYNRLKTNLDNTDSFIPWYKSYLGRILKRPITTLRIDKAWYRWAGGRMVLIHSENWING
jgi:hypothetical protein